MSLMAHHVIKRHAGQHRNVVLTLVERGGSARSVHVDGTSLGELLPIIRANVARESAVMTNAASWYKFMNEDGAFASRDRVAHSAEEYVRSEGDKVITIDTVEGYSSPPKHGTLARLIRIQCHV
jgi:hypothetical protein